MRTIGGGICVAGGTVDSCSSSSSGCEFDGGIPATEPADLRQQQLALRQNFDNESTTTSSAAGCVDDVSRAMLTLIQAATAASTSAEEEAGDEDADDGGSGSSEATKRSANTTARVAVPSSEHVAEIVGRQGCKIKALRNKTNTYIKTPVRGEEPVFVVTGRLEDVDAAKREILSAAEHFTQIRAARRHNNSSSGGGSSSNSNGCSNSSPNATSAGNGSGYRYSAGTGQGHGGTSNSGPDARRRAVTPSPRINHQTDSLCSNKPSAPSSSQSSIQHAAGNLAASSAAARPHHHGHNQLTIGVRVPMSMVGLVVGPKGATIKRIQQDTGTYIVTPGRDRDPVFEVIGSPGGVERARRQIEAYLETRIGAAPQSDRSPSSMDWPGGIFDSGTTSHFDDQPTSPSALMMMEYRNAVNRLVSQQQQQSDVTRCLLSDQLTPAARWNVDEDILSTADLASSMSLSDALLLQAATLCGGGGVMSGSRSAKIDDLDDLRHISTQLYHHQNLNLSSRLPPPPPASSTPVSMPWSTLTGGLLDDVQTDLPRCRQLRSFEAADQFRHPDAVGWNLFADNQAGLDELTSSSPLAMNPWQRGGGLLLDDDPFRMLMTSSTSERCFPGPRGGSVGCSSDTVSPSSGCSPVDSFSTG